MVRSIRLMTRRPSCCATSFVTTLTGTVAGSAPAPPASGRRAGSWTDVNARTGLCTPFSKTVKSDAFSPVTGCLLRSSTETSSWISSTPPRNTGCSPWACDGAAACVAGHAPRPRVIAIVARRDGTLTLLRNDLERNLSKEADDADVAGIEVGAGDVPNQQNDLVILFVQHRHTARNVREAARVDR